MGTTASSSKSRWSIRLGHLLAVSAVAVIALVTAGIAVALTVDVRSQITELEQELEAAEQRVESSEELTTTLVQVVQGINDDLGSVESDIQSIRGWSSQRTSISDLVDDIESVRACMNEYMDAVADAGGGWYTYYYC